MTFVEGTVIEIVFRNEENAYTVLELDSEGKLVTCVGNLPFIQPGEYVRFYGAYTTHKSYGEQFKVASMETRLPEGRESMKLFLSGGMIRGIGEVLADRIVETFGEETFDIIENYPEQLAEVRGISRSLALKIKEQLSEITAVRSIVIQLQSFGLTLNQAMKAYEAYGAAAAEMIEQNPYRLIDDIYGIGFERADRIADQIGMERFGELRLLSGVQHVLKKAMEEGHTCLPEKILTQKAAQMLQVTPEEAENAIGKLILQGKLTRNTYNGVLAIALMEAYLAESYSAYKLAQMAKSTPEKKISDWSIDTQLSEQESLSEEQERAILDALSYPAAVITGGPGTGKTTILNALIGIFERNGLATALAAPTGRAAKRMEQATGRAARTIHRLLEYGMPIDPEEDGRRGEGSRFTRNEDNPLEADVVIIDEMSMVDCFLMQALLKAISLGTRLIMVGDADQLPSVGPGNMLKDIIKSGILPVSKLREIYRQTGNIAWNAHKLNRGEAMDLFPAGDFIFVPCARVMDTLEQVEKLYTQAIIQDKTPLDEIQIICPVRKGMIGVYNINQVVREKLNPRVYSKEEIQHGDVIYRTGDKIMQTVNNYSKEWFVKGAQRFLSEGIGVFNGDIGEIEEIDPQRRTLNIIFDHERVAEYEFNELDQITHAYAITVHKSQGSEFDTVILPLFYGNNQFLTRNLLYTAITRAKKKVILVGQKRTIDYMAQNNRISSRYTAFDHELKKYEEMMERFDTGERE